MAKTMALQNFVTDNIEFIVRDDGIYEINMKTDDRDAVDEWLKIVLDIWTAHRDSGTTFKVLSNSTQAGNIPLRYALIKGQEMADAFGDVPNGRAAYVLANKGIMMSLLENFIRMLKLGPVEMRYYEQSEYDKAVDWLNSD